MKVAYDFPSTSFKFKFVDRTKSRKPSAEAIITIVVIVISFLPFLKAPFPLRDHPLWLTAFSVFVAGVGVCHLNAGDGFTASNPADKKFAGAGGWPIGLVVRRRHQWWWKTSNRQIFEEGPSPPVAAAMHGRPQPRDSSGPPVQSPMTIHAWPACCKCRSSVSLGGLTGRAVVREFCVSRLAGLVIVSGCDFRGWTALALSQMNVLDLPSREPPKEGCWILPRRQQSFFSGGGAMTRPLG